MTPNLQETPDLTSVRTLVTSVTKLANELNITPSGIYRWINVNRIPGRHIIRVAKFYDVDIQDLLPLTGSDKINTAKPLHKPRATLETLVQVHAKGMTLDQASDLLGVPARSLHLVMLHWGDELPNLYKTLEHLEDKEISLETACQRLKVAKYTLHGIRKKYGYAPGRRKPTHQKPQASKRRETQRSMALDVIVGRVTAEQASKDSGTSYRTVFRCISRVTTHKLNELAHWPQSFRAALAEELDRDLPNYAEKWLKVAKDQRLVLKKRSKDTPTPKSWRNLALKRLLVGVLLGEGTVEEIAASRGADPAILVSLFSSDLHPLGIDFDTLQGLPVAHQIAVSDILLAAIDRKRTTA